MANITVDWSDLTEKGKNMQTEAGTMLDILKDIHKEIDTLNQSWESPAATKMVEYMDTMQPKFERYKEVVDEYGKFLEEAAKQYSETEGELQKSAQNLLEFN